MEPGSLKALQCVIDDAAEVSDVDEQAWGNSVSGQRPEG